MTEFNMKLEALKLHEAGYIIMPCTESKQPPKGFNWKFLEKTKKQSPDQIKRWWTTYQGSNIAIIMGNEAFAIDADNQEAIDIIESTFPTTPAVSITGKGKHFLYRMPSFKIGNSSCKETRIDIKGFAGYIVAPPSLHGDTGKRYTWENGIINIKDLPELMPVHYKALYELTKNKSFKEFAEPEEEIHPKYTSNTPQNTPLSIESDDEYEIRDLNPLFDELCSKLNKKSRNGNGYKACCPAHPDKSPSFTISRNEEGDILMNCFSGCSFESICKSLGIQEEDTFVKKKKPKFDIGSVDLSKLKIGEVKELEDMKASKEELKCPDFPKEFLRPPGLVGEICDYINENAFIHQPMLALAASLSLVGTLLGRRIQTQNGIRTNIYTIGIAPTGGGKEWPRTAIEKLLCEAGIDDFCLGGEQFASDTGIIMETGKMPSILYMIDEFGKYMKGVMHGNAPAHLSGIITLLMSIYEKSNKKFRWKQFADERKERKILDQPNLSIFGTTVPYNFWENLTNEQVIDGYLNRFLIFQSDSIEKKPHHYVQDPPITLVRKIKALWDMPEYHDTSGKAEGLVNLKEMSPKPKTIFDSNDATDLFMAFSDSLDKEFLHPDKMMTMEAAMWRRSYATAVKVALIIAGGCFADEITAEHANYGIEIVKAITKQSWFRVQAGVSENLTEKNVLFVRKAIFDTGKDGLSKSDLYNITRSLKGFERDDAIKTLLGGEQIMEVKDKNTSKKGTVRYYPLKSKC